MKYLMQNGAAVAGGGGKGLRKSKKKERSWFLELILTRKEMMKIEFLQFLEPIEILRFSLLSKDVNKIVDPKRHQ